MSKLSFENHIICCEILGRLMELETCSEETKVNSILVNVNHSILDLNDMIDKYESDDKLSVDELRSAIHKVDVMLTCLLDLRVIFDIDAKRLSMEKRLQATFDDKWIIIKEFRDLRGLLLAHPVDMDRGEDTVYLEDVRVIFDDVFYMFHKDLSNCDFVLDIHKKGEKMSHWYGLHFDKSVIDIGHLIIVGFSRFNDMMREKLNTVLSCFIEQNVVVRQNCMPERIADLRKLTQYRYPSFIEDIPVNVIKLRT